MSAWLHRHSALIASDGVLRLYGAAICLGNALTFVFWAGTQPLSAILDPESPAICWPLVANCRLLRVLSKSSIDLAVHVLFGLSILNGLLFWRASLVRAGYILLLFMTTLKLLTIAQDVRLLMNQHYMATWMSVCFLLLPEKRRLLQYMIVMFYFWAGTLKLNAGWLSGAALYGQRPLGLPSDLIPVACALVVVLELWVVFGLWSRHPDKFWPSIGAVLLFHVASFWVVGFFYPLLMFCLLSIVVADYCDIRSDSRSTPLSLRSVLTGKEAPAVAVTLAFFAMLQLNHLLIPGDRAITGSGRVLALHMFDAPVECRVSMLVTNADGRSEDLAVRVPHVERRLSCDPMLYIGLARDFCYKERLNGGSRNIGLTLHSRRAGHSSMSLVVARQNICTTVPSLE